MIEALAFVLKMKNQRKYVQTTSSYFGMAALRKDSGHSLLDPYLIQSSKVGATCS